MMIDNNSHLQKKIRQHLCLLPLTNSPCFPHLTITANLIVASPSLLLSTDASCLSSPPMSDSNNSRASLSAVSLLHWWLAYLTPSPLRRSKSGAPSCAVSLLRRQLMPLRRMFINSSSWPRGTLNLFPLTNQKIPICVLSGKLRMNLLASTKEERRKQS